MIDKIHSTLFLCKDLDQTAKFYKLLGFVVEMTDETMRIKFGDFRLSFMSENVAMIKDDPVAKKGVGMYMYFEVDNVDAFYQVLKGKNITTSSEPRSWPWGKREFAVKDPDGFRLIFFSNIQK